jgi:uncharacterized protein YaaN involved in tellurite resistance
MSTIEPSPDATEIAPGPSAGSPSATTALELVTESAPPRSMTGAEVEQAQARAVELVDGIRQADGSRQMALLDELTSMGSTTQRNAGRQLQLVTGRLSTFSSGGHAAKAISDDLVELRTVLDDIDPHREGRGILQRTVARIPGLRNRFVMRALTKVAVRHETVARQVTAIEQRLGGARQVLVRDNVELRQLYEDVEAQREVVNRQAFLCDLVLEHLDRLVEETTDPIERDRLLATLHDVAMQAQDLRATDEAFLQYFVSIELTSVNNRRLGHAVDRTVALASNVVTVGLAIQAALVNQRKVTEATQRTREFLGEVLVRNAASIREQTAAIGDLSKDPVIALDSLTRAHSDLVAALDDAERLRAEGIAAARDNVRQLDRLTEDLAGRTHGIEA